MSGMRCVVGEDERR